jgi:hypothetical protein
MRTIATRLVGQSSRPYQEQDTLSHSIRPASSRTNLAGAPKSPVSDSASYQVTYQAGRTALSNSLMQAVHAPLLRSALPLLAFTRQPQLSPSFAGLPLLKAPISPETLIPDFTLPLITTAPPLLLVLALLLLLLLLPPHIPAPTTTTTATTISSPHTTA